MRLLKQFDERVLDDFQGVLGVSQVAIGDPVQPALVPGHEGSKRRLLTRRESGEQIGIGDSFPWLHKKRSSVTSAQIDKDTFAVVLGDLDQRPQGQLLEISSAELPQPAPRLRAAGVG